MVKLQVSLPLLGLTSMLLIASAQPISLQAEMNNLKASMEELRMEKFAMDQRLQAADKTLKAIKETPKVAFAVSLGINGLQKTTTGNVDLIYSDVMTNVGGAYNPETGEFKAPVRGVYYIRFTANGPNSFPMGARLYKNGAQLQLLVHEHASGQGSDTASNGATLMLEEGDRLNMVLWENTHIWDDGHHQSTFSGFLVFPMQDTSATLEVDLQAELKDLKASMAELQAENQEMKVRLEATENELKNNAGIPKVAFAVSLGGNGLQVAQQNKNLIYQDVLTNIGGAYNTVTGEFKAPVRGVYYIRFTANGPNSFPMGARLYKNGAQLQLLVHEHASGQGSDTASNGATLMLEEGDRLNMVLWENTHIWDDGHHQSTFSGFLVFPM